MRCYDEYMAMTEGYLAAWFSKEKMPYQTLLDAMRYSVMAGGKRLRPVLTLAFCEACGGDAVSALPVACAAELLHTYSLIHDDLPCMDDDDLRRGKPTCHKVYGEGVATLAGDALQAEAFGMILYSGLPAGVRADCAEALAAAAGIDGICGGQLLDLESEGGTLTKDELTDINSRKTGSLIVAVCRMGVIAAGGTAEQLEAASFYGAYLGAAFQIRDDMLDELSTDGELGKPVGSDRERGKSTMMSLYGAEKCADTIEKLTEAARASLKDFPQPDFLSELADSMAKRRS